MVTFFHYLSILSLLLSLVLTAAWMVGGWLLVRALFQLRRGEHLIAGMAAGWLLYATLINLLTRWLGLPGASIASAALILAAGAALCWRRMAGWKEEWRSSWPGLVFLGLLIYIFFLAQQGVSIFDEYLHLPLVSIMATGDIPPHFYLNPDLTFAYHYGLHLWAASLVRIGGLQVWSALDFSKAFSISLTLMLGYLWARRFSHRLAASTAGTFLFTFGGGTRWLLLLLPAPVLDWFGKAITLSNTAIATANNLTQALASPWMVEGAGAMPIPFAFHNGIFVPVFFALGQSSAMPYATLLLLLLLSRPFPALQTRLDAARIGVLTLLLASLAISAEHIFAFLWLGAAVAALAAYLKARRSQLSIPGRLILGWAVLLAASALFSAFQGAYITETLRGLLARVLGTAAAITQAYGFSVRWPPALLSAHLGILSIFDPRQLLVLLFELGPTLLLTGLVLRWSWRAVRRQDWLLAGLGFSGLINLIFPLFFEYGVDRSTTRMPGTAMWILLVLGFPLLAANWSRLKSAARMGAAILAGVVTLGGVVVFAVQLTAAPVLQPAYYLTNLDLVFSQKYWDQLEPGAQVLNDMPERAAVVFGRAPRTNSSIYVPLPTTEDLITNPAPSLVLKAGFRYLYMDKEWWNSLGGGNHSQLTAPCVKTVYEIRSDTDNDFRALLDLQGCQ